jgi:hypothetical protein
METKTCEHGITSFIKDGGEIVWCCDNCDPNSPNKEKRFRITIIGDYCDDDTLLHLVQTGVVYASVPEHSEEQFCEMYNFIKGKDPVFNQWCARHPGDAQTKRWYDMSIIFDKSEAELNFNDALRIEEHSDHRKIVYSNEFIRHLLKCGFDFGKGHDEDKVLNTVV